MIYFTSDHHFGHENIIKYCNRPFSSVEEMDQVLIDNWNETVGYSDLVYHLGDFCLGREEEAKEYFSKLNGLITIVTSTWHHDKKWLHQLRSKNEKRLFTYGRNYKYKTKNAFVNFCLNWWVMPKGNQVPEDIVLCHFPFAIWNKKHYGAWHLHGHCHGSYQGDGFIYDVGVDTNDFKPVSMYDIEQIMISKGWNPEWSEFKQEDE